MKLVIDIGNTVTKTAVFKGDSIFNLKLVNDNLSDAVTRIFDLFPDINSSILSTVADVDFEVIEILRSRGRFIDLNKNTKLPFRNLYETPETLGKDRLAIAAAAASMFPDDDKLVIDAGTCITYDFINSANEYFGGAISPGFKLRFKSLNEFTHNLPLLEFPAVEATVKLIGSTTSESILSGVMIGLKSEVEHIINRYKSLYPQLKVIISGGDHKYFDSLVKNDIFAAPNIVVYGLKRILDFNEEE